MRRIILYDLVEIKRCFSIKIIGFFSVADVQNVISHHLFKIRIIDVDVDSKASITSALLADLSHWLMVSYCDNWMSLVCRPLSVVCHPT